MVDQQHNTQDAQPVSAAGTKKHAPEAGTPPQAGSPKAGPPRARHSADAPTASAPEVPGASGGRLEQAPSDETAGEKQWYIIHTQTGQELKVKAALETKIQQGLAGSQVATVLVPTERVTEVRAGKKRITERKFFPGYLLVEMEMTDESWHLVRTTQGVTGFIGAGRRPVALSEEEVTEIRRQTEERKDKPTPRVSFQKGEGVRVIEGPFTNFSGVIEEVNIARGKLKVLVSIFGRQTPVELEFWQVERL